MAYIGKSPVIGNFVKLDAITAVNGQAAYTMNNGGSAFTDYESVNQFLVSLNGTIQAPTDSFTVSGSTLTFASNLSTGDVIDFIMVFGNSLSAGTPTDGTVTAAKLNSDIISGQTALTSTPDDTDELLISDAGTIKRIDYSLLKSTPGLNLISTTNITSGTANVDITSGIDSTYTKYLISVINLHPSQDATLRIRFFTGSGGSQAVDSASNYRTSMIGFRNDRTTEVSHGSSAADNMDAFSTQNIGGQEAGESFSANFHLINPSNTTFDTILHGDYAQVDDAARMMHGIFGCRYTNTGTAVTGIRFYMNNGNIDNAIIKLYGIS